MISTLSQDALFPTHPSTAARPWRKNRIILVAVLVWAPVLCLAQGSARNTLSGRGVPVKASPGGSQPLGLFGPGVLVLDAHGNLYAARRDGVFKMDASLPSMRKIPARVAGTEGEWRYSGDGASALTARMNPRGIAVDAAGQLYLADSANHRIRKVDASGVITTVAGNGVRGYSGDGGPAADAQLDEPSGVVVDAAGNLYIADGTTRGKNRIRRVDAATGVIATVAGNGSQGYSGDGGPATSAQFHSLGGMALDQAGNLYIADNFNNRIRMVSAKTGMITTVAGTGAVGHSGDGDLATHAQLNNPLAVAVSPKGDLYIADSYNYRIRRVTRATGTIATLEEDSTALYSDGQHGFPCALALDAMGNLYIVDSGISRIRQAPLVAAKWSRRAQGFSGPHGFANATSGSGLIINVTYCSSSETSNTLFSDCTTSSNYVPAAAVTAFNSIVSTYQALFSNSITVDIFVQFGVTGLGESLTYLTEISYTEWLQAMTSNASANPGNTYAAAATATLPSTDPIGGGSVEGRTANLRALGFSTNVPYDSNLTFNNAATFEYTGVAAANAYDFMDVATHELDEALAIGSALTNLANNAALPGNDYEFEDYFRYSANGTRSITTSPTAFVYFSYNSGAANVARFNQDNNAGDNTSADRNDWIYGNDSTYNGSYTPGTCPAVSPGPYIQDAITCPDEAVAIGQVGSPEWIVLTSLGFNPAPSSQAITFNGLSSQTYGAAAFTVSATASSGLTVSFTSTTTTVCTVSGSKVTIAAAGTCSITASQAGNSNYSAAPSVSQSFTVSKATLTVTANSSTITYGNTPSFTATITGFVNNDTAAVVSGAANFTDSASLTNGKPNAGSWTITPSAGTLAATNYTFGTGTTYVAGTLTVNKATLTVTANAQTVTYGTAPTFTDAITGFVNSDTSAVLSGTASFSNNATLTNGKPNVGSWTITPSAGTLSATNYTFGTGAIYATGTLTVNKATLTVTANNQTITYPAAPTFTITITGFVNSDASTVVSGTASFTNSATLTNSKPNAGSWTITPSAGTLSATNYTFGTGTSYVAGTLTVNKATLTVTANNIAITYGGTLSLTATITGFVNSDTSAVVSGAASFSNSATLTNGKPNAGSWTVTPAAGTLSATNYTFGTGTAYVTGTLNVNQATLTVTANSQTITYPAATPSFTATIAGFVNSDTSAVVSGAANLSTNATVTNAKPNAGAWTITPSTGTLSATNYTFGTGTVYANGTLTVNKASLTVTANNLSTVASITLPPLTATVSGLVNSDTFSGSGNTFPVANNGNTLSGAVTGTLSLATTATSSSPPGSYPINAGSAGLGLSAANYTISFVAGSLTVTNTEPVFSTIALYFGSQGTGTSSATQTVTLTNAATSSLSVTNVGVTGDFSQTNNCTTVVASGSCAIVAKFTPTTTGTRRGTLTVTDNGSNSPQVIHLSGFGAGSVAIPIVSLTTIDLNFAGQALNTTSAAKSVTLTNSGNATLTVSSVTASGNFAQTNNCGSLAVSGTCTINVTFTPTTTGIRTGAVAVVDNATNSPQVIRLLGVGTSTTAPAIGFSKVSLNFGNQTTGTTGTAQAITVTNTGNATLTIAAVTATGDFSASGCVTSLAAGATCTLSVTFKPSASGARRGTIAFADNVTGSPQIIHLFGNGT
jgi:hypothetical protein